jgi:hypothetical protein
VENTSFEDDLVYYVITPETSPVVTPTKILYEKGFPSTEIPTANQQKSPISPALAIVSLGITAVMSFFRG